MKKIRKTLIKNFKNWLIIKGKSEKTIIKYTGNIKRFLQKNPKKINKNSINNFILELKKYHKNSTINTYINALNSFVNFLEKDIETPKILKTENKLPNYFSEKFLLEELIPDLEITKTRNVLKYKTIMYFLFYTGVRIQELINLKREDINLEKKEALIKGKGDKERKVLFNKETKNLLEKYFSIEPEKHNAFNISYPALKCSIERLSKMYNKKFSPHTFRHSFAIHLLKKGFNIEMIRRLLGHSNIETTVKYLKATVDDIAEIYHKKI